MYDSALAIAKGDGTGEMGRGRTLAEQRNVPSIQPDACFVNERCSEKKGRNLQEVMGRG